jgi:hypothetical protein
MLKIERFKPTFSIISKIERIANESARNEVRVGFPHLR